MAILTHRKDEQNASKSTSEINLNNDDKKESNDAYAKLRDAAMKAYHSLVVYGSSMDLSAQSSSTRDNNNDVAVLLSSVRRARLLDVGKNLWMTIRNNPDLWAANECCDFVSFEGKKSKATAGAYSRAIAARLIFLNYIDTRCTIGRAPELHCGRDGNDNTNASLQELIFGLKLFSRAGRALLEHNRKDARSSYDSLSLAVSCYDAISAMATNGNGEAADNVKELFDEAFDAVSMLPNAASLFGEQQQSGNDRVPRKKDGKQVPWQSLVLTNLEKAESFVDSHCNVFRSVGGGHHSTSNLATLQRFLPSLARLCYKVRHALLLEYVVIFFLGPLLTSTTSLCTQHGSHFVKLREHENANKALQIALKSTNSCINEVRKELDQESKSSKSRQMLHNLESELVVVTIEAFYLLSVSYQSSGQKDKALTCLDQVEQYMKEQHTSDNDLHSTVMNKLSSGKDFVFSEGTATSALEGKHCVSHCRVSLVPHLIVLIISFVTSPSDCHI